MRHSVADEQPKVRSWAEDVYGAALINYCQWPSITLDDVLEVLPGRS